MHHCSRLGNEYFKGSIRFAMLYAGYIFEVDLPASKLSLK